MCKENYLNEKKISDDNKIILEGRIYPAIQACVRIRYLILGGLLGYFSFFFTNSEFRTMISTNGWLLWIITIGFISLILLNSYNYFKNAKEQKEKEEIRDDVTCCEVIGE